MPTTQVLFVKSIYIECSWTLLSLNLNSFAATGDPLLQLHAFEDGMTDLCLLACHLMLDLGNSVYVCHTLNIHGISAV